MSELNKGIWRRGDVTEPLIADNSVNQDKYESIRQNKLAKCHANSKFGQKFLYRPMVFVYSIFYAKQSFFKLFFLSGSLEYLPIPVWKNVLLLNKSSLWFK
jgi:hypothetical protein